MKKIYMIPGIRCVQLQGEGLLAASGVTSNNGIGYGGVDVDGSYEADVKASFLDDSEFGDTPFD